MKRKSPRNNSEGAVAVMFDEGKAPYVVQWFMIHGFILEH